MFKALIASGAAAFIAALATPALAGEAFFINPEWNAGWAGSTYGGSVLDGHIGYENGGWSIQAGPSVLMPQGGETEVGFSAKTSITAPVSPDFDVYGEVSLAKYDGLDTGYGLKLGGKYKFK